jgi:hypothetical protein
MARSSSETTAMANATPCQPTMNPAIKSLRRR